MNSVHPTTWCCRHCAASRRVVQSHPPERSNPLWFRSFVDGHTSMVAGVGRDRAREREIFKAKKLFYFSHHSQAASHQPSSCVGQTAATMLVSGAPHHDFHSECTSNDDKGNAVNCNCLRLLLEQRHGVPWLVAAVTA